MVKIFIIAEAGVNHNGCLDTAKRLADVAFDSGADAHYIKEKDRRAAPAEEGVLVEPDDKNG